MIYSFSSLSCYETCPQQFYRRYIARDALPADTAQTLQGTKVHESIEHALTSATPLPPEWADMEPMIAPVRRKMPLARVEQAIHLNRQFEHAVDKLESGFVAKIDVMVINPETRRAVVIDWKTGKPRKETLQQDCYALAVMLAYPDVEHVTTFNSYVMRGETSKPRDYTRQDIPLLRMELTRRVAQIEADSRWAPRQGIPFPCHYCSAHNCPSHPEFVV